MNVYRAFFKCFVWNHYYWNWCIRVRICKTGVKHIR